MKVLNVIALITGLIGIFSAIWRVQRLINNIEDSIVALRYQHAQLIANLDHKVDIAVMTANGYKEQITHNATKHKAEEDKLHGRIDMSTMIIDDLENFIQKTTTYEKRTWRK